MKLSISGSVSMTVPMWSGRQWACPRRRTTAQGGHPAAVGFHLVVGEPGSGRERRRARPLDRARALAIDDAGGLRRDEEIHLLADAVLSASTSPSSTWPENQPPQTEIPKRSSMGPSSSMFIGTGGRFPCRYNPATEAWRRHSSRLTSSESSARSSFHHAMGAIPSFAFNIRHTPTRCPAGFLPGARGRPRTVSRSEISGTPTSQSAVAGHPGAGVRGDRKDGGPVVALRPFERGFEIGKALATARMGAHGLRVFREIDVQRMIGIFDPAILQQVVEAGGALEFLQPVMTAKPPLSQTTTIILWPVSTDE